MEVTDSRAFLQRHHLHNISVAISSPESDPELRAISSAIAHFERLQETTSQCALTLCHVVFLVLRLPALLCVRLRLNVRLALSSGLTTVATYTVESRSIVSTLIVFPHVLFTIFGPELSSI